MLKSPLMNILFIAPLPPPMTGNALPIKVLHDTIKGEALIDIINLSKKNHRSGFDSLGRILQIINVAFQVLRRKSSKDVIYLTLAESFAGNIRDLLIYCICQRKLNRTVVHMLGGAGMSKILSNPSNLLFKINKYFLSRVGAIVVEGKPQFDTFARVADPAKIHIITNFAEDFMFSTEMEINKKFQTTTPLKILFLSNLLPGKGHFELIEAFKKLEEGQQQIILSIAGKTVSSEDEKKLSIKIKGQENIRYIGPVYGEEKRKIFAESHIFCLPTYYPYEGQPFVIAEAYAAGCVVITTNHSGINYIFSDMLNGFQVKKQSIDDLKRLLVTVPNDINLLRKIALYNFDQAKREYTSQRYTTKMKEVFVSLQQSLK